MTCKLLDVETCEILTQFKSHNNSVRCVKSCKYNNNLFASGGRDGNLFLWDIRV